MRHKERGERRETKKEKRERQIDKLILFFLVLDIYIIIVIIN